MTRPHAQTSTTRIAFAAVTSLYFAWGFITSLIDPLVASVRGIFTLSNFQAQASAFAFFAAYGIFSFPAAAIVARLGPVRSIVTALGMMVGGCLLMLAAANLAIYTLVLLGLFLLASGITMLQVTANPLAAGLGDPRRSHFRLTLSQTFNSLGTFIGPLLGAHLFLRGVEVKPGAVVGGAVRERALSGIDSAYFWVCGLLIAMAAAFWLLRRVVAAAAPEGGRPAPIGTLFTRALSSRWALLGGLAIFLYVGAEVAIGTQLALFLNDDAVWGRSDAAFGVPLLGWAMGSDGIAGVSLQEAGKAVAFYWGGAMVGRAIGSALLARVGAAQLLTLCAAAAVAMCLYVAGVGGVSAGFVALAIGLFNSIMFPIIFSLTLERSTAGAEATSGFLCTAIVGGAILPLVVGKVADATGYGPSFVVPALCYAVLCGFALMAARAAPVVPADDAATARAMH